METKETGFTGLFDEEAVPEAREARLREGIEVDETDRLAEPCDKTDVCY